MEDFSVVIIARNEEKTLPRLLGSLKGVHDIVVLDTGSTDKTAELARHQGCNVVEVGDRFRVKATGAQVSKWRRRYGWEPSFQAGEGYFHFAKARNYAATLAKNDWCFCPDADEEVEWDLDKVREAIQNEDHLTYRFCYAHDPDGKCGLLISQSKFYRRSKMRWEKHVHEVLQVIPGQSLKPPRWCDFIYHQHYQNPQTSRGQYLPGLELSVLASPKDDRNVYYLAREYMYCQQYTRAIRFFDEAIKLGSWVPEKNQAYVYQGISYKLSGEPGKAIDCFHKAMAVTDTRREPYWELGALYEEQDDFPRALVYYLAATAVPFTSQGYLSHKTLYTWKIPDKLAFVYGRLGNESESKRWWLEVIKHNPPAHLLQNGVKWFYRDNLPLVSIIVPTMREEGYERLAKSVDANTVYPRWEIVKVSGKASAVQKFNQAVEKADGDLIVYLADDTEVEPGWLTQAFVHFRGRFRDKGLVILNDGYWEGRMANHFLCSKNVRGELRGEIWHSGYHHWGVDNELFGRLKQKNLVEYCERARITHHHFCTQTRGTEAAPMDEVYQRALKWQEQDARLLYRRQKKLGFGPRIAAFTTSYNEAARIREYVENALRYVDEVYISDNGSTDGTAAIAVAAGAHVRQSGLVHTPENYNEGATKQRALEFAQGGDCDWFLFLEPDEMLERRAAELLPAMVNDFRFDTYGMRTPTFWLGRSHYRTDGDFGEYYLTKPYPLKLWRRGCGVQMTIPRRGGHSGPTLGGDPSAPKLPRHRDSELRVRHHSFDTREMALAKHERYRRADPGGTMSKAVGAYKHLHPDYAGAVLEEWKSFEFLEKYDRVLVTGPQRSGTRVCAQMIAQDTGFAYVDEQEFGIGYLASFAEIAGRDRVVIQCPGLCRYIHEFGGDGTAVVLMRRNVRDIVASQRRIGWESEPEELALYGHSHETQAEAKYAFWDEFQERRIVHAFEIDFECLSEHPLWVPKRHRRDFEWQDTIPKVDFSQERHPECLLVAERVGKPNGRTILDIGCGANKTIPEAIGIDVKPVTDVQCSGDDLAAFGDGSVDFIIARHSLEHFIDPVQALAEWRRVLKPGGKMVVVLPDHERIDTMGPAMNAGDHLHAFTQDSFGKLVDLVPGLELVEQGLAIEGWSFYAEISAVKEANDS